MMHLEKLAAFRPKKGLALQHQIESFIRDLISRKELPENFRLPPNRELAKLWKTNYFTVQAGLSELVRAGMIVRRPRLGTFIRYPQKTLTSVGIYHEVPWTGRQEEAFNTTLHMLVYRMLAERGIMTTTYFDQRNVSEHKTPPEALIQDVRKQRIQALIATFIYEGQTPWLVKLPIPNSNMTQSDLDLRTRVEIDMEALCKEAVQTLVRSRVKTAGLITHTPASHIVSQHLPQIFLKEAAEAGITVKPEWIVIPKRLRSHQLEQTGYELFQNFWDLPNRPHGLFIFPDIIAKGVIGAILQKGIELPRELVLVAHKNAELDIFAPVPVQWVEVSIADFAAALIHQVEQQIHGKPFGPVKIKPRQGK